MPSAASTIESHIQTIYGESGQQLVEPIQKLVEKYRDRFASQAEDPGLWDERDIALITYGDQISDGDQDTLKTLKRFLLKQQLEEAFSIVHILPFCPYSSDDGFSVIDFRKIDERLGDWEDLESLSQHVDLMYDLVLNHVSQHSDWFQGYLRGEDEYRDWFHAVDPALDLSQVTRPRSHPLLSPYETSSGTRHIWTTFSADQIDLNYGSPALLLEMLDILLMYAARGGRVIRLDAIAFLWKEIGTTCLHLKQTHAVVKLFRSVLEQVAPRVLLLTETNVPHPENVSYFGDGDEAHMVYNFSLPPLLYDAYVHGNAEPLQSWLAGLEPPQPGATWFNFTASHDGIGVRPLEGLVDEDRFQGLVDATRARGGEVSMRQMPNGDLRPYELNISWCAAMASHDRDEHQVERTLGSQAMMLGLQGIPAAYFHSLVGTPNYRRGVEESGHARRINRRKYDYVELSELIEQDPLQSRIFAGYQNLLRKRRLQAAFHPQGAQRVLPSQDDAVVAFERTSPDGSQSIFVVSNFACEARSFDAGKDLHHELIEDVALDGTTFQLRPCQTVWLQTR